MRRIILPLLAALLAASGPVLAQEGAKRAWTADLLRGLPVRNIGPVMTSGRVADIAVDPKNRSVWYIVSASGGLWKTTNRGLTLRPIFDNGGSYSLGCVTVDPNDSNVVWLGTGENQSQRSVGYGDGVYKSTDAGATWQRVGLPNSEHIAKIVVDPRNSQVVYVAAQGPLWAPGGDRGLYKTTDGGKTWKAVLTVSENTGVTDVVMDPRNADVLYAAAYQRRRQVGQLIGGGPEAGVFKSGNGGATWTKLTAGLPEGNLGRIALAVSPQQPDVVYALVVASGQGSGFFRSADCGGTWTKMSNYRVTDPQYYGKIFADPHKFDRLYAVDVAVQVTEDGGKTVRPVGWGVHSDNHAIVIDPTDERHLLVGNDGGLYESYDGGRSWNHFLNLEVTQFYHIATDNAVPFYNVYAGAQDNGSQGGPSRTLRRGGINPGDWYSVGGADGMQPRVDPNDPNTVYSMSQNGAITRLDLRTGVSVGIRPAAGGGRGGRAGGEGAVRWNWNAPFIISPHSPTRMYLAGSRLFRSDNRGDSWTPVSPDLTRHLDRNTIPIMGQVWGADAITPNLFTTDLSVITALAESPLKEGLLYVGTDDGLLQVSEDGGQNWRMGETFPGVPAMTTVMNLFASRADADTVYAAFNNYQRGDFKPHILKSTDRGKSWTSVAGDLPERHVVWSVVEDAVNRDLLFAGTEFGLFASNDGGKHWARLSTPTVAFRDVQIHARENDLVCGTFGRGFFILDDITPLRRLTPEALATDGAMLPPRRALLYEEVTHLRAQPNAHANPPFGAALTYYVRDPGRDDTFVLTVTDAAGKKVSEITHRPASAGVQRIYWSLRAGDVTVAAEGPPGGRRGGGAPAQGRGRRGGAVGPLVPPGKYTVTLSKKVGDQVTPIGAAQELDVVPIAALEKPK